MAKLRGDRIAFGWPGSNLAGRKPTKMELGPHMLHDSRVWYTIGEGILNEIYYPTIDSPQIRDLQYLITDGERSFTKRGAISIRRLNVCHAKASVTGLLHPIQQDSM